MADESPTQESRGTRRRPPPPPSSTPTRAQRLLNPFASRTPGSPTSGLYTVDTEKPPSAPKRGTKRANPDQGEGKKTQKRKSKKIKNKKSKKIKNKKLKKKNKKSKRR
tara:strand:+ start:952 stop:1275 length:324 start_codon:yes stop_codon:yes gene_type:complete